MKTAFWAFTFDKPGFWRYHNHMVPEHSGLIVATGGEAVDDYRHPVFRHWRPEFQRILPT